jgi:hypothetical protein
MGPVITSPSRSVVGVCALQFVENLVAFRSLLQCEIAFVYICAGAKKKFNGQGRLKDYATRCRARNPPSWTHRPPERYQAQRGPFLLVRYILTLPLTLQSSLAESPFLVLELAPLCLDSVLSHTGCVYSLVRSIFLILCRYLHRAHGTSFLPADPGGHRGLPSLPHIPPRPQALADPF